MLSLSRMNKQHRNAGLLTQPVCMLSEAASVSSLLLRSTCYQGITLGKEGLPQKSEPITNEELTRASLTRVYDFLHEQTGHLPGFGRTKKPLLLIRLS